MILKKFGIFYKVVLFYLCPTIAFAGTMVEASFPDIPVASYAMAAISTILGGVAGTLHRMYQQLINLKPGDTFKYRDYFIATNMASSLASGFVTFLFATHWGWSVLMIPAATLVAGFSGSIGIEWYMNKFFPNGVRDNSDAGK